MTSVSWLPMWRACQPCLPDYGYDYVMDFEHSEEDKEAVFAVTGLNASVPLFPDGKPRIEGTARDAAIRQE